MRTPQDVGGFFYLIILHDMTRKYRLEQYKRAGIDPLISELLSSFLYPVRDLIIEGINRVSARILEYSPRWLRDIGGELDESDELRGFLFATAENLWLVHLLLEGSWGRGNEHLPPAPSGTTSGLGPRPLVRQALNNFDHGLSAAAR